MTVAYVLSMKSGLPSFNRDELLELENHTIPFILYATKIGAGPYTPNRDWKVRSPNPADTLIGLFGFFTRYPRRFGRALSETVREFLWAEFLVAAAFAWDMRRHGVTWIHAHFGDRKVLVARLASILLACTNAPCRITPAKIPTATGTAAKRPSPIIAATGPGHVPATVQPSAKNMLPTT